MPFCQPSNVIAVRSVPGDDDYPVPKFFVVSKRYPAGEEYTNTKRDPAPGIFNLQFVSLLRLQAPGTQILCFFISLFVTHLNGYLIQMGHTAGVLAWTSQVQWQPEAATREALIHSSALRVCSVYLSSSSR